MIFRRRSKFFYVNGWNVEQDLIFCFLSENMDVKTDINIFITIFIYNI